MVHLRFLGIFLCSFDLIRPSADCVPVLGPLSTTYLWLIILACGASCCLPVCLPSLRLKCSQNAFKSIVVRSGLFMTCVIHIYLRLHISRMPLWLIILACGTRLLCGCMFIYPMPVYVLCA